MEEWICPNVQEWAENIETLGRVLVRYPQTAYARLATSLNAEWQYLMHTVPGVIEYMGPMEKALANNFMPKLLGLDSISGRLRKLMEIGYNRAGLGIMNTIEMKDEIHRTSLVCSERLVDSLIIGEDLFTPEHRYCVRRSIRYRQEIK